MCVSKVVPASARIELMLPMIKSIRNIVTRMLCTVTEQLQKYIFYDMT